MFGSAIKKRDGKEERRSEHMRRLTMLLSDSDRVGAGCILDAEIGQEDLTLPAAEDSVPSAGPVDGGQDAPVSVNGNRFEEAAWQASEALSRTLSEGVPDVREQAARDQAELGNVAETLAGLVSEFRQVKTELAAIQKAVESQTQQWSELNATLALFDNRLRHGEAELLQAVASSEARLIGLGERFS
jgi:hypothetical protein